jgi:hypothetical protein
MSKKNNAIPMAKFSSPLLQVIFIIRRMRNEKQDYLLGKVLTIIDGIIVDEKQNKAIKDLLKDVFHTPSYHWDELEEMIGQFAEKYCPNIEDEFTHKITRRKDVPHKDFEFN